jgi:hypothetical protein
LLPSENRASHTRATCGMTPCKAVAARQPMVKWPTTVVSTGQLYQCRHAACCFTSCGCYTLHALQQHNLHNATPVALTVSEGMLAENRVRNQSVARMDTSASRALRCADSRGSFWAISSSNAFISTCATGRQCAAQAHTVGQRCSCDKQVLHHNYGHKLVVLTASNLLQGLASSEAALNLCQSHDLPRSVAMAPNLKGCAGMLGAATYGNIPRSSTFTWQPTRLLLYVSGCRVSSTSAVNSQKAAS